MKLFWVGLCAVLLTYEPASAGFPPVIIRACVREMKIKALDLAMLFGTEFEEASQTAKCYINCLLDGIGFTVGEKINPNIIDMMDSESLAQKPRAFQILNACKDIKATGGVCELGYLLFRCFIDRGKVQMMEDMKE